MIALPHDQLLQIFDIDPDEIADVTAEDGALEQVQYLQKVLLSMKHPLATQMGKYGILQVNQYGQEGLKRRHAMEYIEFYQHARNSVKKSALFLMMEMQEDTSSGQDKAQLYFVMSGDITESKEDNEGPHFVPTGIFCCTGSTNIPTTVSCNNIDRVAGAICYADELLGAIYNDLDIDFTRLSRWLKQEEKGNAVARYEYLCACSPEELADEWPRLSDAADIQNSSAHDSPIVVMRAPQGYQ